MVVSKGQPFCIFIGAGAQVFLTGRHLHSVQRIADEILVVGGAAEAAEVDAFNERAIGIICPVESAILCRVKL